MERRPWSSRSNRGRFAGRLAGFHNRSLTFPYPHMSTRAYNHPKEDYDRFGVRSDGAFYRRQQLQRPGPVTSQRLQQPPPLLTANAWQHPPRQPTLKAWQQPSLPSTTATYQQPPLSTATYQQPPPSTAAYQQPLPTIATYQQPGPSTATYQQPGPSTTTYQQPGPSTATYHQLPPTSATYLEPLPPIATYQPTQYSATMYQQPSTWSSPTTIPPFGKQDLPTNQALSLPEHSQCTQSSSGDSDVSEQPQLKIFSTNVGPSLLKEKLIYYKAPGSCTWQDVFHFFPPHYSLYSDFQTFIRMMQTRADQIPSVYNPKEDIVQYAQQCLHSIQKYRRHNDERVLMPFIHLVLFAATMSIPGCEYDIIAEPLVVPGSEDMTSDMAMFETENLMIIQDNVLRVLLEVKGTGTYPYGLEGERAKRCLTQLFQQVALAHASGLWQNSLLCGLVTSMEWNFFQVQIRSSWPFQMFVTKFHTHKVDKKRRVESVKDLVAFIMAYLDECTDY